jgi:hypothetical protein
MVGCLMEFLLWWVVFGVGAWIVVAIGNGIK